MMPSAAHSGRPAIALRRQDAASGYSLLPTTLTDFVMYLADRPYLRKKARTGNAMEWHGYGAYEDPTP